MTGSEFVEKYRGKGGKERIGETITFLVKRLLYERLSWRHKACRRGNIDPGKRQIWRGEGYFFSVEKMRARGEEVFKGNNETNIVGKGGKGKLRKAWTPVGILTQADGASGLCFPRDERGETWLFSPVSREGGHGKGEKKDFEEKGQIAALPDLSIGIRIFHQ